LRNLVETRALGERAGLTESGNAGVHQPRIVLAEGFIVDAEPELDVGPKIFHHHIGGRDQAFQYADAFGFFQIERDRALVAMRVLIVGTLLPSQRIVAAHMLGHLHLNYIGAPVRELSARGGAGPYLR
jgi:hypothetical protein